MNTKRPHTAASSNDTQPLSFSFGIVGISSHLTPKLVSGYSQNTTIINNKCKEPSNGKLKNH